MSHGWAGVPTKPVSTDGFHDGYQQNTTFQGDDGDARAAGQATGDGVDRHEAHLVLPTVPPS